MNKNLNQNLKKDLNSSFSIDQQQKILMFLKNNEQLKIKELVLALEKNISVPVSIFTKKLGSLECICKFLKEHHKLSNIEIAKLVGRTSKSVWQAINQANKKYSGSLEIKEDSIQIPVKILDNEKLSVLETLVHYIKNEGLSYHNIAKLLDRDDRTIWTIYQKAIKKLKNERLS